MKDLPVLLDRLETAGGPADPVPSADARIRPAPAAPSPVTARAPVIFWLIVLAIIPFMVLNYNGVLYSYYVGRELRRPGRTYLYASAISIGVLVVLWVGGATTVLALFTVYELVAHSRVYGKFSWESILTLVIVLGAGPVIYAIARSVRRQRDALDLSMAMHELPPE